MKDNTWKDKEEIADLRLDFREKEYITIPEENLHECLQCGWYIGSHCPIHHLGLAW